MSGNRKSKDDTAILLSIALVEHIAIFYALGLANMGRDSAHTQGLPPGTALIVQVGVANLVLVSALYLFAMQKLADQGDRVYWVALALVLWPWITVPLVVLLGPLVGPSAIPIAITAAYAKVALMLRRQSKR